MADHKTHCTGAAKCHYADYCEAAKDHPVYCPVLKHWIIRDCKTGKAHMWGEMPATMSLRDQRIQAGLAAQAYDQLQAGQIHIPPELLAKPGVKLVDAWDKVHKEWQG